VLEAVGQLAAWVAMARTDFASRPVAALVGEARLGESAWCERADGPVELTTHLERIDGRAVLYTGTARCGGQEIASLSRCVGPLLPVALFDDPEALRQRLAMLRAGGAGQRTLPPSFPPATSLAIDPDGTRRARLSIPNEASYFADHFPRRPVFPATLLAAALDALAAPAAAAALGGAAHAVMLRDYKVRAFSEPGSALNMIAEPEGVADRIATVRITAVMDGKRTASGRFDYRVEP
jgi:3-hydroxymyristoyl/3-hydroxydecanoyl-(acyl carrier protein) dehydratase